ncbi:MAG: right-handed parallel beta-helix repeat-containing protein, partial [Kineosporiaceae bacterium]
NDASSRTRTLLGDCTATSTVPVPDGWTLDGAGHSITAKDPAGAHFTGAVVRNAGAAASVRNLTVTASGLADVCDAGDDRLRGILLDGAAGAITNNRVVGVRQDGSGCQEGNGIEVRNEPFDTTGPDLAVTVSGNEVLGYQKAGIVANGSVLATVTDNTVTGLGPVGYIAQNGVQLGFGASGIADGNTITDNWYTGPDLACGLLLYRADGVKQKRNTFVADEQDLCNLGRGGGNVKATA